jgi:peptidoglycan biosynthesis protein MviN/MurJ (putative lipid II flippase)
MVNQTERPKPTRTQVFGAIFSGLLPYLGGLLVILTRRIGWLALAAAAICVISTSVAYTLRKSTNPVTAKQRLMVDPLLYGFEFAFTAVLIRYVFMRYGDVQILKMKMTTPVILCLLGAISWLWMSLLLRSFKVRSKPPASRAHLSLEQRQQRIRMGSWIVLGGACFWLIGAILLAWLQQNTAR